MEEKLLKPYKGFNIEKTWELNLDGTIKKTQYSIRHLVLMTMAYLMQM